MEIRKLSIIIPVFNEDTTVYEILKAVSNTKLISGIEKEIIVVNDCSVDESESKILSFIADFPAEKIKYIRHEVNHGKGAAVRNGFENVSGDFVIIQDADLELDPTDMNSLLQEAIINNAAVVYGSRFLQKGKADSQLQQHYFANVFLTRLSNFFSGLQITDMATCYKLIRSDLLNQFTICENRFGLEPEITAKLAKIKGIKIIEAPITYQARTKSEGKKIGWKDGFRYIYCIVRYNLFK
ncbi:MAG: glycosyltransferase family 2 protein [Bacteroidetes bacterium]|nr:glycosyltransferase family 2 protein [Bacteroidota bacterium]